MIVTSKCGKLSVDTQMSLATISQQLFLVKGISVQRRSGLYEDTSNHVTQRDAKNHTLRLLAELPAFIAGEPEQVRCLWESFTSVTLASDSGDKMTITG